MNKGGSWLNYKHIANELREHQKREKAGMRQEDAEESCSEAWNMGELVFSPRGMHASQSGERQAQPREAPHRCLIANSSFSKSRCQPTVSHHSITHLKAILYN